MLKHGNIQICIKNHETYLLSCINPCSSYLVDGFYSYNLLEYLFDRVREAEHQMKQIADRVYKVGRRPDEADSRSGIQSRQKTG
jgi:hypothetical protein